MYKRQVNTHLAQFGMDSKSDGLPRLPSNNQKEETYLRARRSLQIWPLDQPMGEGFSEYWRKYLTMTPEESSAFRVVKIVIVQQSKLPNECLIEFETLLERDGFRSYAPRLQLHRRYAGMRISLPDPLVSVFKVLENEALKICLLYTSPSPRD